MAIVVEVPEAREPGCKQASRLMEARGFFKELIEGGFCHLPISVIRPDCVSWPELG